MTDLTSLKTKIFANPYFSTIVRITQGAHRTTGASRTVVHGHIGFASKRTQKNEAGMNLTMRPNKIGVDSCPSSQSDQ